jgi:hypothetical protein
VAYRHLLQSNTNTKDFTIASSLQFIDKEMRQSRGRDLTARYVPLLAAFAILDQIGGCYSDIAVTPHPNEGGAIHRA